MKTIRGGLFWGLGFLIAGNFPNAYATPVFSPSTGHWYEAVKVPAGITWPEAYTNAIQRGGYLCTITNAAENTFVASLVDSSYYSGVSINNDILGPWLGGFRHANESNWQWVSGEPFVYTAWYSNQPDGYGGSEQRLQFYAQAGTGSTWGDHPGTPISGYSLPRGFIVEYNQPSLSLSQSNQLITLSLPVLPDGWILETTTSLSDHPIVWSQISTNLYQTNLTGSVVIISNSINNAFFRLRKS